MSAKWNMQNMSAKWNICRHLPAVRQERKSLNEFNIKNRQFTTHIINFTTLILYKYR